MNGFIGSQTCSVHATFNDYNEQKSCYRFLSNPKVSEQILINHLKEDCRDSVVSKRVLALVDTSTVNLNRYFGRITNYDGIGTISRNQHKSSYGFFLHPIYVVDADDGTPYGLADVRLFNRSMESNPLTKSEGNRLKLKLPIESKESYKWVEPCERAKREVLKTADKVTFVMDREADIWEVYKRLPGGNTDVVVRAKENRCILNSEGEQTKLKKELEDQQVKGEYIINLPKKQGRKRKKARVKLKYGTCQILPSQFNKPKEPISLSYVEIKEVGRSKKAIDDPIHWIIWTSEEVNTVEQAEQVISIYARRWKIEVYFKLLKSDGFDIENCQLGTGNGIRKLTLLIMEAAIKVQQLKAARRGLTNFSVEEVFEEEEIKCLKLLNQKMEGNTKKSKNPYPSDHLSWASWIIARLGGWKEYYEKNNLPGNKTFVKGLKKFDVLMLGYLIAK